MNESSCTQSQLSAPFSSGYRMPAEWEKHDSVWLSWPYDTNTFKNIDKVEQTYVEIITALHTAEKINLLVLDETMKNRSIACLEKKRVDMSQVIFHLYDYADVWFRDYGPVFLVNRRSGKLSIVNWTFNAWGGKYDELLKDDSIPVMINRKLKLPLYSPDIVLEGGSIDVNGEGVLLTTKQCLLNKNRNSGLSLQEIESYLRQYLGAEKVIWLEGGIAGDDTDGHVDDVARFVNHNTVLAAWEEDENDANFDILRKNYKILSNSFTIKGEPLRVKKIPMPKKADSGEENLPASYVNFYIGNNVVLVPVFGQKSDKSALEIISGFFPEKSVEGIDCCDLVRGFGAIHCITQQQPSS